MVWERSCGAVVFIRREEPLYVIVQERQGTYSFPKGHMEDDETELETARREILEETGLQPVFLDGFRLQEEYCLSEKPGTWKRVTYFLAEADDVPMTPQAGEIRRILLLPYPQALETLAYENTRQILTAAKAFLEAKRPE